VGRCVACSPSRSSSGDTPLFWAAILNNLELARYLIGNGANVNFQQAKYKGKQARDRGLVFSNGLIAFLATPLHAAARRGLSEMCTVLLDSGADVTIRERHGQTAGQWLSSTHCKAVHVLSDTVKARIGFKEGEGSYKEEEPDLKFWGKYGPPPKLSKEEEAKYRAEEKAVLNELSNRSKDKQRKR
jgi:hypothetical protein